MKSDHPKSIVWLSSFPKSGNTWLRILLANYLINAEQPVPINQIGKIALGDSLARSYRRLDPEIDVFDEEAVVRLRRTMLSSLLSGGDKLHFLKTHSINSRILDVDLIPPELTKLGVYIVRNPLDVVSSYADHYGIPTAMAAEAMSTIHNRVTPKDGTVTQYIGGWSDHVASWAKRASFPVHVVRYEDLHAKPVRTFKIIVRKLGLKLDQARMEKAIEFSSFQSLQRQEEAEGFIEKSEKSARFFRSGIANGWQGVLDDEIVSKICSDHGKLMKKFGYL